MHRIPRHESRCAAYHGHRYIAEITCGADKLDSRGRVVDFAVIKDLIGGWIDAHWDHTAILMRNDPDPAAKVLARANATFGRPVYWMDEPPSAECLVSELARVASGLLAPRRIRVVRVKLWETPNSMAEWLASSEPVSPRRR